LQVVALASTEGGLSILVAMAVRVMAMVVVREPGTSSLRREPPSGPTVRHSLSSWPSPHGQVFMAKPSDALSAQAGASRHDQRRQRRPDRSLLIPFPVLLLGGAPLLRRTAAARFVAGRAGLNTRAQPLGTARFTIR
jgi:hypothetical protein